MSSKEEGSSSSSSELGKKKKSGTMVVLRSSEGETFEVEEKALMCSQTLRHMIEDDCAVTAIPLPNVTAPVLAKIVDYCNRHATASLQDLKTFDSDFLDLDQPMLFDLLLAANYLDITSLLDSTCQAVADMMKGKSPEEIRTLFNIKNDFTEEEEAEVRRENAWAFE